MIQITQIIEDDNALNTFYTINLPSSGESVVMTTKSIILDVTSKTTWTAAMTVMVCRSPYDALGIPPVKIRNGSLGERWWYD